MVPEVSGGEGAGRLISFRLGFHAEYTTSEPLLRKIAGLAQKYQAPVYTHNSETRTEVEQCSYVRLSIDRCTATYV